MKKKYDVKKVSRSALEDIAECVLDAARQGPSVVSYTFLINGEEPSVVKNLLTEAEVPLRTRAAVDADIVQALRTYTEQYCRDQGRWSFDSSYLHPGVGTRDLKALLRILLSEETSD